MVRSYLPNLSAAALLSVLLLSITSSTLALRGKKARLTASTPSLAANASLESISSSPNWPIFERDGKEAVMSAISKFVSDAENSYPYRRNTDEVDWDDGIVYHIMTDRFNDGDPSRNNQNLPPFQTDEAKRHSLHSLNDYRHGGDLAGIMQRLDYLADLGVSVLWITPILKHTGTYHGYCTSDPTQIDPGFGSNEDFRDLVKEAHAKGMKVVMDIVVNHMCDLDTTYSQRPSNHEECTNSLNAASWSGAPSDGSHRGKLAFSPSFFGPLRSQGFFSRCGTNSGDDTSGSGAPAVFGDFADGFFDYDTRHYDFQEVFTELHKYWIAFADVDGFRLDAAKHVTEDFIAHFSVHIRDYANSLGKSNFYIIGEVAADVKWEGRRLGSMMHDLQNIQGSPSTPASLTYKIRQLAPIFRKHPLRKYPGLDSIYDFYLGGTMRNIILNYKFQNGGSATHDSSPARIADYFSRDYQTVATVGVDMKHAWVPLEIHDWPRLLRSEMGNLHAARQTAYLSAAWLLTMQGQPIIYYGFEQGFAGACAYNKINISDSSTKNQMYQVCGDDSYSGLAHSVSRQSMFSSSGWQMRSIEPAVDSLAYIGSPLPPAPSNWKNDPYLNRNTDMYKVVRKLIKLRHSCSALRHGDAYVRIANDYGLLAFSRLSSAYEIVVMMNVKRDFDYMVESDTIIVDSSTNRKGARFKNILNPEETAVVHADGDTKYLRFESKNGKFRLGPRGFAIFVPETVMGDYNPDYGTVVCLK